jgi:glycosyltransferase involved in cell wall biosynthesis
MRICIVYDCLHPQTPGGAQRWYLDLARALSGEGHDVTYLTMRQWPRGEVPDQEPFRLISVGPKMKLYTKSGRRRIKSREIGPSREARRRAMPPLVFGLGVLWHLLRHGRRYDVVHVCAFPYSSLMAAALLRPLRGYRLVVDWFEVWTSRYWREYVGALGGPLAVLMQRACVSIPQRAFCFSAMHARRLREEGLRSPATILRGLYSGPTTPAQPCEAEPLVVFAARLIPEKRAPEAVAAIAAALPRIPGLRAVFYGEGPEQARLADAIAEHGLEGVIDAPGFVDQDLVDAAQHRALCMLSPSRREGYGLVVVEAAARATPSVVVAGEDNAATELVVDGVNGVVASSENPEAIADAIVRVHEAGFAMRESTARWFAENAEELSLDSSLRTVLDSYGASDSPELPPHAEQLVQP